MVLYGFLLNLATDMVFFLTDSASMSLAQVGFTNTVCIAPCTCYSYSHMLQIILVMFLHRRYLKLRTWHTLQDASLLKCLCTQ